MTPRANDSGAHRAGTLYVVATPIGNLEDFSPRAARVLREVDLIAAEDTRRVAKLLAAHGISKPTMSFHAYSGEAKLRAIIERLAAGDDVALVSDAGTPCVSDPGAEIVAAAWEIGARVVPIPGPCAAIVALAVAGFAAGRFFFAGYPPRRGSERRRLLETALSAPWPAVFYESPERLAKLLDDIAAIAGADRLALVARELTKLHEELARGPIGELAREFAARAVKGEVTVVVAGASEAPERAGAVSPRELARWLAEEGLGPGRIAAALTRFCGLPRAKAYEIARAARDAGK